MDQRGQRYCYAAKQKSDSARESCLSAPRQVGIGFPGRRATPPGKAVCLPAPLQVGIGFPGRRATPPGKAVCLPAPLQVGIGFPGRRATLPGKADFERDPCLGLALGLRCTTLVRPLLNVSPTTSTSMHEQGVGGGGLLGSPKQQPGRDESDALPHWATAGSRGQGTMIKSRDLL